MYYPGHPRYPYPYQYAPRGIRVRPNIKESKKLKRFLIGLILSLIIYPLPYLIIKAKGRTIIIYYFEVVSSALKQVFKGYYAAMLIVFAFILQIVSLISSFLVFYSYKDIYVIISGDALIFQGVVVGISYLLLTAGLRVENVIKIFLPAIVPIIAGLIQVSVILMPLEPWELAAYPSWQYYPPQYYSYYPQATMPPQYQYYPYPYYPYSQYYPEYEEYYGEY